MTLEGGEGNDILTGGQGDDVIDGGTGNDTLRGDPDLPGAHGSNTFVFRLGDGQDIIRGFDPALDRISLMSSPYVNSMSDIFGSEDPAPAASTTISTGPGYADSVTLEGVSPDDLSPANFVFAPPPPQGGAFSFASALYTPFSNDGDGGLEALPGGRLLMFNAMRGDAIGLGTSDQDILLRIYDAQGVLTRNIAISGGAGHNLTDPSVAVLSDGRFVVTWLDVNLYARIFDTDGTAVGDAIQVNPATGYRVLEDSTVWARGNGGFSVAWATTTSTLLGNKVILERDFDAAGTAPVASRVSANYSDIARLTELQGMELGGSNQLAFHYNTGTLIILGGGFGGLGQTALTSNADGAGLKLTMLADGRALASWFEEGSLFACFVGAGGGASAAFRLVGAELLQGLYLGSFRPPPSYDVAAMPGGGAAIFWTGGGDAYANALRGAIMAPDGTLGADELINPYDRSIDRYGSPDAGGGQQYAPHAVTLDNGRVAVGWTDNYAFPSIRGLILDGDLHGAVLGGGAGGDSLTGSGWNDTLTGLAGDDILEGRAGPDVLDGGAGRDTATYRGAQSGVDVNLSIGQGTAGDANGDVLVDIENVTGSDYRDMLQGSSGANLLRGGYGDDTLLGLGGADTLEGGPGADTLDLAGPGVANGGRGNDKVTSHASNAGLFGDAGDDTLTTEGASNYLVGGDGRDTLIDLAGAGSLLLGDSGDDTLHSEGGGARSTLRGGEGDDRLEAIGGSAQTLQGEEGRDVLIGTDLLQAFLLGGADADSLEGTNARFSTFRGEAGDDDIGVAGGLGNTVEGGAGNDLIHLGPGEANAWLLGGDGDDVITGSQGAADQGSSFLGGSGDDRLSAGNGHGETLNGGLGDDILSGADGADSLVDDPFIQGPVDGVVGAVAVYGRDSLFGGAGDDLLSSAGGRDTLDGGEGFDRASITRSGTTAITLLVAPGGLVNGTMSDGTVLRGIEQVSLYLGAGNDHVELGGGDDYVLGGEGRDTLSGGAGRDWLDGGSGRDRLAGGQGDDLYVVDDAQDEVIEGSGEGYDTVLAGSNFILPENIEALSLFGEGVVGVGNAQANRIDASSVDAFLWGLEGDDTLLGGAGDDVLRGDVGNDSAIGGQGNDVYVVDSAGDVIVELDDEGIDTVWVGSAEYILPANVEIVRMFGGALGVTGGDGAEQLVANPTGGAIVNGGDGDDLLWGSPFADTLNGQGGDDILRGQGGADVMNGGSGHDSYVVLDAGATIVEEQGEGYDTAYVAISGYVIGPNVEVVRLVVASGGVLTGSDTSENLVASPGGASTLYGQGGDDTLWGSPLSDTLIGGAGDDIIRGQGGADTMVGGLDNDQFVVLDPGVVITENAGEGYDTAWIGLAANISFTLAANVERGNLSGAANRLTGNAADNVLVGSASAAELDGGAGEDTLFGTAFGDTLTGGAGDDTLYCGGGADVLMINAPGWGADLLSGFQPGAAKIDFTAASGVTSFGQLSLTFGGGNTQVQAAGNSIYVFGVTLSVSDFIFS